MNKKEIKKKINEIFDKYDRESKKNRRNFKDIFELNFKENQNRKELRDIILSLIDSINCKE